MKQIAQAAFQDAMQENHETTKQMLHEIPRDTKCTLIPRQGGGARRGKETQRKMP